MVAIGGIADIVHRWREMARSRMTHLGSGVCIAAVEHDVNLRGALGSNPHFHRDHRRAE